MSSRTGSHTLKNGLVVSGQPEKPKERLPTMSSCSIPYTGGDVKKSGDLGKMYGINIDDHSNHHQIPPPAKTFSRHLSASAIRSGSNSGQMGLRKTSSGPMNPILPTGRIFSGPLHSSTGRRSGQLENTVSTKASYSTAVTSLSGKVKITFGVSSIAVWLLLVVLFIGLVVGAFLWMSVKEAMILIVMVAILVPVLIIIPWNCAFKKRGFLGYLRRYRNTELRGLVDGQYVKVTGVVTCGSAPLTSSFQRVPRCVYVSTELYEYKGWAEKSTNTTHCFFSWGCRFSEKHVSDFYISDSQSGLRALVKAGNGAKVAPFIKQKTVVDIKNTNKGLPPNFIRWLSDRNLSRDDRIMCLKEGYIKEGSIVSVMGVIKHEGNVVMIVPPEDKVSTGCQWIRFLAPTKVEGLVVLCDEDQDADADVIPV